MGVPYYFKYLTTNVKDCVIAYIHNIPVILYLDFNSIIYEAKNNISIRSKEKGWNSDHKKLIVEYEICEEVVKLMEKIINSVGTYRLKQVYIAIDGAAPMAKIIQQRQRRFKSAFETENIQLIAEEEGIEQKGVRWDTNAITPGTKFMDRLCSHLEGYIAQIRNYNKETEFILDSSKNQGEGEHKLLNHMDTNRIEHMNYQKVIYGLDADLIILSMLRGYNLTYLYRETSYYPFQPDEQVNYLYMDVSIMRNSILKEYWQEGMDTQQRLIIDYVFLTYLLGNDFVPNLFILKIQKGGFELLNELYTRGFSRFKCHLINKDLKINLEFFRYILDGLYKKEEFLLKDMYDDHCRFRPRLNPNISQYERRVTMLHYYPTMMAETDTIHLGQPGWRERLYKYWLDVEPDKYMINGMCENYLEGLSWILQYYVKGCPSQMWYYKFPITPSIKDLLAFFSQKNDRYYKMEWNTVNDDKNYNWTTYQLLLAIPKSSIRCIPKDIRPIVQHRYFWYLFPTTFKLKTLYKRYYHDCYPVLPRLEDNILENIREIAIHN
jgi:5'-3' exonuclease